MKLIVTSEGESLEAKVDQRFGRARYFILVDSDSMKYEVIDNEGALQGGGAGVKAAQIVIDSGAQFLITGNVGPNAYEVLKSAGIKIIIGVNGTVKDAIKSFKDGKLKPEAGPNVGSHHGLK